ncbi:hypothetical protein CSAL01_02669 [Colletotrichum salicis]|uniref:Uncharacterized protein n=1 Tax=Colletotrichum salicis TaxID=1209931 RepID=A0A135SK78_9PEZI|nr:hypothetical protein CSAL01_02669 [Colletotrichum salicis]
MASKGVSLLKFVGTVSLGLLTVRFTALPACTKLSSLVGPSSVTPLSHPPSTPTPLHSSHSGLRDSEPASDTSRNASSKLSTANIAFPSILSLPSASDALRAFKNIYPSATARLRLLTGVSATSFLLAFFLSPRAFRHPYLVYASVLTLSSGLAEQITPYVLKSNPSSSKESIAARRQAAREREQKRKAARIARQEARMEASYEVLGDTHSDGAGSASGDESSSAAAAAAEEEEEALNGEEIRGEVDGFRKTQLVQSAVASVGFLLSVIGIWGDGAIQVFKTETVIVGV